MPDALKRTVTQPDAFKTAAGGVTNSSFLEEALV
jgi:hypothetical protein